jgi:hypothetical protein
MLLKTVCSLHKVLSQPHGHLFLFSKSCRPEYFLAPPSPKKASYFQRFRRRRKRKTNRSMFNWSKFPMTPRIRIQHAAESNVMGSTGQIWCPVSITRHALFSLGSNHWRRTSTSHCFTGKNTISPQPHSTDLHARPARLGF